jgi:hypothetical protein
MLYPIELRALKRITRGQNGLFVKAEDTTPEAFVRQALRTILFKPLQVNANLPLSRLIPLSNIIKSKKDWGRSFQLFNVCRVSYWPCYDVLSLASFF